MGREYDIFEKLQDGSLVWRAFRDCREQALRKLRELSAGSSNEFLVVHTLTKAVIASVNGRKNEEAAPPSRVSP